MSIVVGILTGIGTYGALWALSPVVDRQLAHKQLEWTIVAAASFGALAAIIYATATGGV